MGELRWVESPLGAVALDDRTYPVCFATWVGKPDDAMVRAFFSWNDALLKRFQQDRAIFSILNDAIDAQRPESPQRSLIAELTRATQTRFRAIDAQRASNLVILENPLIRGALTAIGWLMEGGLTTEYAANCAEAIRITKTRFEERGAEWPAGLSAESYRRPRR